MGIFDFKGFGKSQNIEQKSDTKEEKSVSYSTRFGYDGYTLDGDIIARNNTQFYKMYRVNTDIRRAIKEKQETSMKSGWEVTYTNGQGNKKVVEVPEFEGAMERSGGINKLKNDIIKSLDIFGYAFIRRTYNGRGIRSYEVLDSRYVSVITDSYLVPTFYLYNNPIKKGLQERYPADDIIRVIDDNDMDNPVFGISPLETIVLDVLGDEESSMSNMAYFKNDGIPSALYVLQPGLTADQQKKIYDQIQETLKGGHNKHKSIASSAIIDVKTINAGHTDMDFEKQRMSATVKVCVALGVSRSILGYIDDVNYSNGDIQYKKFIENTIRPLEKTLTNVFNIMLHDFTEYAKYDFRINDEHIDDYEQRCKLARDNILGGIWTINRAREYIGDEASPDDMADELIIGSNTRLLSDLLNGTDTTVGTPTEATPQAKKSEPVRIKLISSKK